MTDPHDDFDELASAHLDGLTSPDEAARVDADPALRARVEELRAVRAALSELPVVDAARRDAAIAAALAAFEEEGTGKRVASPAPVTPLAPRRRLSPTTVRVLSAAAVVAVLALLVPLLSSIDSGDDDATSFEATGNAIGGEGDDATSEDAETSGGSTTSAVDPAAADSDLGTYDDLDALADAVTAGGLDPRAFVPQEQADGLVHLCPSPTTVTEAGTAVVADEPVIVWIGTTQEGRRVLTVVRADGCEVIEEREL
jgi:hypothetical protein